MEHLLCECLVWANLRNKILGSPYLEARQLRELENQQEAGMKKGKGVGTMG